MNTQTHLLLAAALLARRGRPRAKAAVLAGALMPDAGVLGLYAWAKATGVPDGQVWRVIYFAEPMQSVQAVFNSVPVYAALLVVGLALGERAAATAPTMLGTGGSSTIGQFPWLALFALAALVHIAGDLPVHVSDAHRHFWPLSDWRFMSPVSYWDPAHHGRIASALEALLGLALCTLLWRRFVAAWVRAALVLAALLYVAVPLHHWLTFGGA